MMMEFEAELLAQVSATKVANRNIIAAVLLALGQARALDIVTALTFVETIASALRQPVGVTDPAALRTMALAADEMQQLRVAMDRLTTIPAGAGTA